MKGVKYAVPLYSGGALVKLSDGTFQPVTVIGLDDASLFGRPELIAGQIEDLYADDAFVVVRDSEFAKLNNPSVGTTFEINDHRGVVVGIARVPISGLFGIPTLYTTYRRAIEDIPTARYTLSYVLVQPDRAPTPFPASSPRWNGSATARSPPKGSCSRRTPFTSTRPASAPTSSS